jgi:hypothetical protein
MYVVPSTEYTIDATAKTITLSSTYSNIVAGQVSRIVDMTSGEVLYDANAPRARQTIITVSSGVITYQYGLNVKNTDVLRIVLDSTYPATVT